MIQPQSHQPGQNHKDHKCDQPAGLLSCQYCCRKDHRQICIHDIDHPAGQRREKYKRCIFCADIHIHTDIQEILHHIHHLFYAANVQGCYQRIQRSHQCEKDTGYQNGDPIFQHLSAKNFIAAVRCQEQHITLLRIQIPVQRQHAFQPDISNANHCTEKQYHNTCCQKSVFFQKYPQQKCQFRYQRNHQQYQFGKSCFPKFIFH